MGCDGFCAACDMDTLAGIAGLYLCAIGGAASTARRFNTTR